MHSYRQLLKTVTLLACVLTKTKPTNMNRLLKRLLLFALMCTFLEEYVCDDTFTKVGDTQLSFVNEALPFADAERYCESKDSKLVEFWSAGEWKEVRITDPHLGQKHTNNFLKIAACSLVEGGRLRIQRVLHWHNRRNGRGRVQVAIGTSVVV